ncbi:MAG: hypothetical protein CL677_04170 [Bdellovibrionaceae bacterium]|nr:hypothetical protein [Pseudobdellovibrionaceae bacterium]
MIELNQINKHLNSEVLLLQTFPLQGRTHEERRLFLREQIITCFKDSPQWAVPENELSTLKDLTQPPTLSSYNLSLSHSGDYGGFIVTEKSVQCGFDMESKARIHKDLIARISSPEEMEEFGEEYRFIWAFKESCFKALNKNIHLKLVVELQFSKFQLFPDEICISPDIRVNGECIQGVTSIGFEDDRFIYGISCRNISTLA